METDDDKTQTYNRLAKWTMVGYHRIIEKIDAGGMEDVYLKEQ